MRGFFEQLAYKLRSFMAGRYINDELNTFMAVLAFVLVIINNFIGSVIIGIVSYILLILVIMRSFSKNFYARSNELRKYNALKQRFLKKYKLYREMWTNRKTHKYIKCKNCKAVWRYPKGKGKIEITCRNCKTKMIKKT